MEFLGAVCLIFLVRTIVAGRRASEYVPPLHVEKGPRCSLEEADRLADEWRSVHYGK